MQELKAWEMSCCTLRSKLALLTAHCSSRLGPQCVQPSADWGSAFCTAVSDHLTSPATLFTYQQLVSASGAHELRMQPDGTMALYEGSVLQWSAAPQQGAVDLPNHVDVQPDGNVVMYNADRPAGQAMGTSTDNVWASDTSGAACLASMRLQ